MANDPVNSANGVRQYVLEVGMVLTVTGSAAGTRGSVTVLTQAGVVESTDKVNDTASKGYGPYTAQRTVRLYAESGRLDVSISSRLAALPAIQPPTVSADGKTLTGQGVKPNSSVVVYDVDTGVTLGTTTAAADGSWVLVRKDAVSTGQRVGYDAMVVGPYATVGAIIDVPGQVVSLTLGAATDTTQPLSYTASTSGGSPSSYTVEFRKKGDSVWTTASSTVTGLSYTVTGLVANQIYQYRVTASNGTGAGTPSSVAEGSTAAAASTGSTGSTAGSTDFSNPANSGLVPTV